MASNTQTPNGDKNISALDRVASRMLQTIDSNYNERKALNRKNQKFQKIIDRELDLTKSVTDGNIVDFATAMFQNSSSRYGKGNLANQQNPGQDSNIFQSNVESLFGYFQDSQKNKFLELQDLKFISKFIPGLGKAVKVTLNHIVSSDDISNTIIRNLVIDSSELDDAKKDTIIKSIENIEREGKLLKKIKNVIVKNTLVTGRYYVYAVGYRELFENYAKNREAQIPTNGIVLNLSTKPAKGNAKNFVSSQQAKKVYEACFTNTEVGTKHEDYFVTEPIALESTLFETINSTLTADGIDSKTAKQFATNVKSILADVSIVRSPIPYDVLNTFPAFESTKSYKNTFPETEVMKVTGNVETVVDGSNLKKGEEFNFPGTYIKYIDAKRIVKVKVLDEIIGYYYVFTDKKPMKSNMTTDSGITGMTPGIFNNINLNDRKKTELIDTIASAITDEVVKQFNHKFVEDNIEFKRMIANCILYNGFTDTEYKIQFIPVENMIEFKINEDEDDEGTSMLADALFPAKLLLALLICKLLNYMNKTGNKNIAHIYKGPIDVSTSNQVQRVIRNLQESNITFADLLSNQMVFSKFTRDTNIAMPRSRANEKLVEFETMEGQNIDMSTDMEDKLEKMALMGTGVPMSILNIDQPDIARSITSDNIEFAGTIAGYQADFEEPLTDLYKILIKNSNMPDEMKNICQKAFLFKFPRPKVLSNNNSNEFIGNIMSLADSLSNIIIGESQASEGDNVKIKDELKKGIIKAYAPYIQWDEIGDLYKIAELNVKKEDKSTTGTDAMGNDNSAISDYTANEDF